MWRAADRATDRLFRSARYECSGEDRALAPHTGDSASLPLLLLGDWAFSVLVGSGRIDIAVGVTILILRTSCKVGPALGPLLDSLDKVPQGGPAQHMAVYVSHFLSSSWVIAARAAAPCRGTTAFPSALSACVLVIPSIHPSGRPIIHSTNTGLSLPFSSTGWGARRPKARSCRRMAGS